jgi:hypothetical protein
MFYLLSSSDKFKIVVEILINFYSCFLSFLVFASVCLNCATDFLLSTSASASSTSFFVILYLSSCKHHNSSLPVCTGLLSSCYKTSLYTLQQQIFSPLGDQSQCRKEFSHLVSASQCQLLLRRGSTNGNKKKQIIPSVIG